MSFRDEFLKARLARMPAQPPAPQPPPPEHAAGWHAGLDMNNGADEDEELEELDTFNMDSLGAAAAASGNFLRPRSAGSKGKGRGFAGRGQSIDYSPVSGAGYFAQALNVQVPSGTFRVYYTPPTMAPRPPGSTHAGFSAADDADDDDEHSQVVFVCHHGAGYSAMSFALLAKALQSASNGRAGVIALDARGHGKTQVNEERSMSIDALSDDLVAVVKEIFPDAKACPNLVLVGHSMGGSVVVKACGAIQKTVGPVVGVVNLDVVEGTAMEFLSNMMDIINSRPSSFERIEDAIAWHVTSRTIGNLESAKVSVPPLFRPTSSTSTDPGPVIWRTDLPATQPYWEGWFSSLSSSFLSQRCAKLLVLAGAESLDKDLMIGQMQGKYQLTVFQDVGHCLQEEAPERLAATLVEFWKRNDQRDILKNVKKVGQV